MGKDLRGKELGEGICQRKDGRYFARFTTCTGSRRQKYCKTAREAQTWLAKEREKDGYMNLTNMTLDDWYNVWIENYKKDIVRANTCKNYETNYRIRIKSRLGKKRLEDITSLDCQRLMNELYDSRKYAYGTLNQTKITLHAILKGAVENRYIVFNPADGLKIKQVEDEEVVERRMLTREEQRLLIDGLRGNFHEIPLLLILETGLRAGELGGLKWEDIDFENRQIHVKRTLLYSKAKGGFYFGPPKSKHSVRDIPMTEVAYDLLKRQNIVQKKMQLKSLDWTDEDKYRNLVFTSNTGHAIGQSHLRLCLCRVVNDINLELKARDKQPMEAIYPHALRHTFATRCIENGMQPKVLQKIMGHSTLSVTMDLYVHVTDESKKNEMKKMDCAV